MHCSCSIYQSYHDKMSNSCCKMSTKSRWVFCYSDPKWVMRSPWFIEVKENHLEEFDIMLWRSSLKVTSECDLPVNVLLLPSHQMDPCSDLIQHTRHSGITHSCDGWEKHQFVICQKLVCCFLHIWWIPVLTLYSICVIQGSHSITSNELDYCLVQILNLSLLISISLTIKFLFFTNYYRTQCAQSSYRFVQIRLLEDSCIQRDIQRTVTHTVEKECREEIKIRRTLVVIMSTDQVDTISRWMLCSSSGLKNCELRLESHQFCFVSVPDISSHWQPHKI